MENAAEALLMGFAVLVFALALTIGMTVFSNVRAVSDLVLYTSDETNYYEYQGATGKAAQNRIVGLETILPTLYKYYQENYTVCFREGNYNETTGEFSNTKPLTIYTTPSTYKTRTTILWGKNYDSMMKAKYTPYFTGGYNNKEGSKDIFSFDLEEETLRHEPWTGSLDNAKENLRCFLWGYDYKNLATNNIYIRYGQNKLGTGGFIGWYKRTNPKFVETIGEYTYSSSQSNDTEDGSSISSLVKEKKKRMVIFTKIN